MIENESNREIASQVKWKTTSSHFDQKSGITHIYTRQIMDGQPIIGTESSFHFDSKKKSNYFNLQFREQSQLKMTSNLSSSHEMSHKDLLFKIAQHLEIPSFKVNIIVLEVDNENRSAILRADHIAEGNIPFKGVLYFDNSGDLQYAYSVQLNVKNSPDWWEVIINSKTGEIIDKANYTISCAPTSFENYSRAAREKDHNHSHCSDHGHSFGSQTLKAAATAQECYLVYPYPMESPYNGPQVMSNDPADTIASPYGWHDTNGAIGAEYTITRGNNVWAKEDQNGDNEGTIGFSPDGGANLVFNFPVNDNNDPSTFVAGAVTNLFYWNNLVHDVMHYYGFDEASGNFQETNYSGQGQGGDYVNADAQDSGNCNANFSTPPDGSNPRMQMYTCTNSNPSHDSDLDNGVIVHEYGHGISIRLTGGSGNSFCLQNDEQMGEGWSDYFALMFTIESGDLGTDSRGIGNYLIGAPINGDGIRPYPYSTDLNINPQTYDDIKTVSVPHGVGSVWCTMLWEMTWGLIEQYGYDSDIYQGNGGNNLALRLVTEALKLQPCSPGFVDGRDAILKADTLLNGGVNSCIIWNAFAKRGLGVSADQGSNFDEDDGTEAFDTPIGTHANCLDNSDFFVVVSDKDVKSCDTFTYNLNFFTNSGESQKVGLTLEGLQDTVETIFSVDSVDVPGDLVLQLIDTIGLPAFTSLQFSVLASNGSETDTVDLVLTKFGSPNLEIIDGCAFDTSSQVSLTFNCGLNNLHSYILPDSLTSEAHEYENLVKGTYQVIVEDTINDLILFDSTILINPMEIDTVEWDTVRMHASETHLYAGFISSCPGVGELDVYQNSNRIAITDYDTSESVINVNSSILPNFMEVQFTITHTWTSDLNIFLKSPSGTLHPLFISPTNCSQDNINVTVTDTASLNHLDYAVICDTSNTGNGNPGPPYAKTGQFKGQTALNDLMATGISGVWTLVVVDRFNYDQGYIEEFSIHFTYNKATEWFTDPNGQNLITTGDSINPFYSVLTPGVTDTVQIYESCVFQGCNSKPIPITFMIYDDVVELLDNMGDCNINKLSIDNSTISDFPDGTQVKVNEIIHSSAIIDNTMNFIFSAGNSLEFTQGFEIQLGGALEADVKPCEDP